ncbi:L-threonine 3-dehydrogenase [Streptomyces microflavus]
MKAVQYRAVGEAPEVVTVPDPEPGPGQVLLKVTAAGVCHSDIAVMSWPADQIPFPLPLTLGHEGVGTVAALGDGVHGLSAGDSVAVYGPWGCGICVNCAEGKENYCLRAKELGIMPPGLGAPGAMAEYMIVDDPRHLVPIGDLDPVKTVSLTDAGLTPYHAIKRSLPKLVPGATAVVIGTGGLGHVAIQLLRAMTAARVIALDVTEEKLDLARAVGAHEAVLSDEKAAARVMELTGDSARTSCWTSSAPRPPWRPPVPSPGSTATSRSSASAAARSPSASEHFRTAPASAPPTGARARSSPRSWTWPTREPSMSTWRRTPSMRRRSPTSGCTTARSTAAR